MHIKINVPLELTNGIILNELVIVIRDFHVSLEKEKEGESIVIFNAYQSIEAYNNGKEPLRIQAISPQMSFKLTAQEMREDLVHTFYAKVVEAFKTLYKGENEVTLNE